MVDDTLQVQLELSQQEQALLDVYKKYKHQDDVYISLKAIDSLNYQSYVLNTEELMMSNNLPKNNKTQTALDVFRSFIAFHDGVMPEEIDEGYIEKNLKEYRKEMEEENKIGQNHPRPS